MPNETNISMQRINQFHDDHQWRQHHDPKDLAISISLEANELLEIFQWRSSQEAVANSREHLEEEIADVLIYTYTLAEKLGMDIDAIIEKKLEKNLIKYPVPVVTKVNHDED